MSRALGSAWAFGAGFVIATLTTTLAGTCTCTCTRASALTGALSGTLATAVAATVAGTALLVATGARAAARTLWAITVELGLRWWLKALERAFFDALLGHALDGAQQLVFVRGD